MIFSYLLNMQSHPSWVCGLKLEVESSKHKYVESHPSWVCGLKHSVLLGCKDKSESHPSWVCGLKLLQVVNLLHRLAVTPFVGVWIET